MASPAINTIWSNFLIEDFINFYDVLDYLQQFFGSPLTVIATATVAFYLIYRCRVDRYEEPVDDNILENGENVIPMFEKDMDIEELALYNSRRQDGRFLIALKGSIFDVSSASDDFGPGGVYAALTGTNVTDHIHQLADEYGVGAIDHVNEWYDQLKYNFPIVGSLLDLQPNDEQNEMDEMEEDDVGDGDVEEADVEEGDVKEGDKKEDDKVKDKKKDDKEDDDKEVDNKEEDDTNDDTLKSDVHNDTPFSINDSNDATLTDAA